MRGKLRAGLIAVVVMLGVAAPAVADVVGPIDFESYALGPIWGQNGWTGGACGPHDIDVTATAGHPGAPSAFGSKSYRISNASVSGCYNDSFSPQTNSPAGESTAAGGTFNGAGPRQPLYVAQFTIASSTGAAQGGLNIQVSPDRGDGARMSYLRARHVGGNLEFEFIDVDGTDPGTTPPCSQCAHFRSTVIGPYDPTKAHTVRIEMRLLEGPSNDVVRVLIDGVLVHTGKSWEDYYRLDTESSPTDPRVSRTADSLLIRASGDPAPANLGKGFLIDALTVATGPLVPYKVTKLKADPIILTFNPLNLHLLGGLTARLTSDGAPVAGEPVTFSAGGGDICTGNTNANGVANCAGFLSLGQLTALLNLGYKARYAGDETYFPSSDTAGLLSITINISI